MVGSTRHRRSAEFATLVEIFSRAADALKKYNLDALGAVLALAGVS